VSTIFGKFFYKNKKFLAKMGNSCYDVGIGGVGMKEIARRLKEAYTCSGLTIVELSRRTGIPSSCVHRYVVTGETEKIPINRLKVLAVALGVTPEYIMGWEKKEETPGQLQLTEGEKAILALFRQVPVEHQNMVVEMIRVALKQKE
jgi:transcriptional regulator with XRE-family HTH domain